MSFKEELLKAKSNSNYPKAVEELLDNGMIQECETIDNIHYITFAFSLSNQSFYNYLNSRFYRDFSVTENADVIYVGGLAIDNECNILKGIIYPYYTKMRSRDEDEIFNRDMSLLPYTQGTPQIINKSDKLSIRKFFVTNNRFRIFNLSTSLSDTWAKFALGKETYLKTFRTCDEDGHEYDPDKGYNDLTFFGIVKNIKTRKFHHLKKYGGSFAKVCNAISIPFVEKELKNNSIQSSIATKIFCVESANKARIESAHIQEEGMYAVGASIIQAGKDIRAGASNIANAVNPHPEVVYYV